MRVSVLEGYRLWAPTYDCGPNPLIALETRTMQSLLGEIVPPRVIDVGCGTARWMLHFTAQRANVFGIDCSPEMLVRAQRHRKVRARLVLGEAANLPFRDASAGLVVCALALGHIRDLSRAFAEMSRVSEPRGRVAVSDIHPDAIGAGWTGLFKRDGKGYEVENCAHSLESIRNAAGNAGLHLKLQAVAHFGPPERDILARAGKAQMMEALVRVPAVWAAVWEKP